jgi:hypothetical protein
MVLPAQMVVGGHFYQHFWDIVAFDVTYVLAHIFTKLKYVLKA